jgi:hypothetical protein
MAHKNRSRFNTGLLPQGEGEFADTGCHTPEGNNLCLHVNSTQELFKCKERAFAEVLGQKQRWHGATEFSVPMRMQKPAETIFDDALAKYKREMEVEMETCPEMFEDFLCWLCRDFEDWIIEKALYEQTLKDRQAKEDAA